MNKKTKIILGIVIAVLFIVAFFVFQNHGTVSVSDALRAPEEPILTSGNQDIETGSVGGTNSQIAIASGSSSFSDNPPPKNNSSDSDIDTYLKAYRTVEQPNPNDFNDSYSDLK